MLNGSDSLLSALSGINNSAALWARAQALILDEKQKQLKLTSQQQQQLQQQLQLQLHHQQMSPKGLALIQSGAKRSLPNKEEEVTWFILYGIRSTLFHLTFTG